METAERHGGRKPGTHLGTHLDTGINKMGKVEGQLERQVGARSRKSLEAKKRRLNFIKKIILSQTM